MTLAELLDFASRYQVSAAEARRMVREIEAARREPVTREERRQHYAQAAQVGQRHQAAANARPPVLRTWCIQCERNVTAAEADKCRSQWCKAKAVAA